MSVKGILVELVNECERPWRVELPTLMGRPASRNPFIVSWGDRKKGERKKFEEISEREIGRGRETDFSEQ